MKKLKRVKCLVIVKSHVRKGRVYVKSHVRTKPDKTKTNNLR